MAKRSKKPTGLKTCQWKEHLHAPDAQLVDDLYSPALERAIHYDRCCAYFSSSVLSAAARGFGGLIQTILDHETAVPKPAVRLLVNEELDPDDLEAMLSTDDCTPLINKLLKQFKTPKDALERERLKMLAWLVASGWLQVRVGVMRNTGGILHAKYGIVKDFRGDCIAFMGSDNETGEGLFGNYEELRLFTSWKERKDTDYYQTRFDQLWEDQDANVQTIPLPLAVEEKLIKLAPKTPPTKEPVADRGALAAAMMWRYIAAAPFLPNGEYACDATAMVDMWPHQRKVVEDTARAYPAGRLLCDEVGMGKTIEAILVLRRLLCGRGVQRALLMVPAGLLKQWQDELREKGGLLVPRWEDRILFHADGRKENALEADAFSNNNVLLVSREWARLENNRQYLLTCPKWDLVLLDEAHAARRRSAKEGEFNSGNLLLDLLRELQLRRQTRGVLLLSATPMQTQPWEPWDLLQVLGVGGKWLVEFNDIRNFYGVVAELPKATPNTSALRAVQILVSTDTEFPPPPNGSVDGLGTKLAFAVSNERSAYSSWLRSGAPLGRRMHRNTRDTLRAYHEQGLTDYAPPVRDVEDVVFDYNSPAERRLYDAVKHYIDDRFERLEHEKGGKGFVMTIYRRRAASSPYALRKSLERRLDGCEKVIKQQWLGAWRPDEEELDARDLGDADIEAVDPALPATAADAEAEKKQISVLLDDLNKLGYTDSKFDRFRGVLDDITADGRPALVFTEYYDTLTYLRDLLQPAYSTTLACYSGNGGEVWDGHEWHGVSKAEITERLRQGKLRVLVCTDAASEGLNLQAASALVNYDLPWNPSKVEQRIGRIDRIGQQQPVLPIRNMFLDNSVDMRVYQVLQDRCGLFKHFVGRMQPVLALARDALRRERPELIDEIRQTADSVDADQTIASIFVDGAAVKLGKVETAVNRQDLEAAVGMLEGTQLPVRVKRLKGQKGWRLSGATAKTVEVSADRETLERNPAAVPLSLGSELLYQVNAKIPLGANRVPLVVAEHSDGPYKAVEVRWVDSSSARTVRSASELRKLIDEWDGNAPLPGAVLQAQDEARQAAKKRVQALVDEDRCQEQAGVDNQLTAARTRLMRELGRTLRCIGSGDLGALFQTQISRESRPEGRYRRAYSALGAIPSWTSEELADIDAFVKSRPQSYRQARIAGAEIDAALNDPRWKVVRISPHADHPFRSMSTSDFGVSRPLISGMVSTDFGV